MSAIKERPLQLEDLWPLPGALGAATLVPRFGAAMRASRGSVAGAVLRLAWRRVAQLWITQDILALNLILMPFLIVAMIRFLDRPEEELL